MADRFELGAHLERRGVDVAAPVEVDQERRLLGLGARADLLDAGERRERFLDRARDQLLDFLGRRAGVGNHDLHAREADVRKLLERQQVQRDQADQRPAR